jgi:phosphate-selective porin
MTRRFQHIIFCAAIGLVLSACSKGGSAATDDGGGVHVITPNDVTAPEISIFTPTANQSFSNGSVINITGRITDDFGLYQGTIRVVNDATGFVLLNQPYEIHGLLLYNFSLNYTVAASSVSDYTITVSFQDHGLNTTTKSVKVKAVP